MRCKMLELDKILPVTKVKKNLLDILKNMSEDHSTITVTKNGKPVSIIMTPDRYDALMETIEILADLRLWPFLQARQMISEKSVFSKM